MEPVSKCFLWGATGQARVIKDILGERYQVEAIFDNNPEVKSPWSHIPIYYGKKGLEEWAKGITPRGWSMRFAVAVGGDKGEDRMALYQYLISQGFSPMTIKHESAIVAKNAWVGEWSQVLMGAKIGVGVEAGYCCIYNTGSIVDHDCEIGTGVHVMPGAVVAGEVKIGDFSMIGSGAVVLPRVRIGRNCRIGAGAVVTKDVPDGKTVKGVPAK